MSDKDHISSVSFALRREGELSFLLLLDRAGLVKRMGSSKVDDGAAQVMVGEQLGAFDELMTSVPEGLLSRAGTYEADEGEGQRHDWRIEFHGGPSPAIFDLTYHSASAGLPKAIAQLVERGERLTDAWYADQIGEAVGSDPVAEAPASATSGASAETETATAAPAEGGTADAGPPATGAAGGTPRVTATKKRIALAVLLDFVVLGVPYFFISLMGDGLGPPGGGLVLFAIVELGLLQFARRSPGYWLLGIQAPLGEPITVDGEQYRREAWWTLFTGYLLLGGGAEGLTAWLAYESPIPYFGLQLGVVVSALITVVLASGMVASGVLILRADVRGAWIGLGCLALSGLTTVIGWEGWVAWIQGEIAVAAEADGRPMRPEELASFTSFLAPMVIGIELFYLAALGATWKRLASPGKVG